MAKNAIDVSPQDTLLFTIEMKIVPIMTSQTLKYYASVAINDITNIETSKENTQRDSPSP